MNVGIALCDTHVHVFDPARFAYASPRRFTPAAAALPDLRAHLARLGATQVVLVQPSVYGDDNSCLLHALDALQGQGRGVIVTSGQSRPLDLARLQQQGVRGARLNLVVEHNDDPQAARAGIQALEARLPGDWHIQLHVSLPLLGAVADAIRRSRRTFVLDHLGLPDVAQGTGARPWQQLLALLAGGRLYVKVSAPYLASGREAPHADLTPFLDSLLQTRPDRLLWGSNWPHTQGARRDSAAATDGIEAFRVFDDCAWRDHCQALAGPAAVALLAGNARGLYGFESASSAEGRCKPKRFGPNRFDSNGSDRNC